MEHAPQPPFLPAVPYLDRQRQTPGELHHPVVQQRRARLEACAHRGPIHLDQDVVGKIRQRVDRHQPLLEFGRVRPARRFGQHGGRFGRPAHHGRRIRAGRALAEAKLFRRPAVQQQRQFARPRFRPEPAAAPPRPAQQAGRRPERSGREDGRGGAGAEPAQRRRRVQRRTPDPGRPRIMQIAAEQLVTAVPGEGDGHVPARQRRHQEGRNLRGIGEGLVEQDGQARDDVQPVPRRHVQLGVLGSQMAGHRPGVLRLVVTGLLEPDREGPHRAVRLRLHQRDDGRRVDPAGQEGAERDVRGHLPADRLDQQAAQGVRRLFGRAFERLRAPRRDDVPQRPVRLRFRQFAGALPRPAGGDPDVRARGQFSYPLVNRPGRRDVEVPEQQGQRAAVDVSGERGMRGERLQLGPEQEHAVLPAVVEGLFAHPVAGQRERPVPAVPEREREHAGGRPQRFFQPPAFDGGQQGFRVGTPPPRRGVRKPRFEPAPEIRVVVDLAVEDDDAAPRRGQHRLAAGRRQVDDGQAAVRQCDPGFAVEPDPGVVRAAVRDRVRHRAGDFRRRRIRKKGAAAEKAGHSAHANAHYSGGAARRLRRSGSSTRRYSSTDGSTAYRPAPATRRPGATGWSRVSRIAPASD